MDREGHRFDLVTQRFIVNRWETELGRQVREKVIHGLKSSIDMKVILDPYVLDHPENIDPYGYPHYPENAMTEGSFWVLTNDDLRGMKFYHEDFPENTSFDKKSLTYSSFYSCDLRGASFDLTDLSYASLLYQGFCHLGFWAKKGGKSWDIAGLRGIKDLKEGLSYLCGKLMSDKRFVKLLWSAQYCIKPYW